MAVVSVSAAAAAAAVLVVSEEECYEDCGVRQPSAVSRDLTEAIECCGRDV